MSVKLRNFYEIGNQVNDDPIVVVFENFLSDLESEQLVAAAVPRLEPALVSDEKTGVESPGRSGRTCWIAHEHNAVIEELSLRVAEIVGIPLENAESLQVVYYGENQQYLPHFDAWEADTEVGKRCMARGGQRMVTCLMYLNEVEEGGGTSFPKLDMVVRPIKNRMVLFHNCSPGTTVRHPASLHGGMPVLKGEKWACNFWFRESSYQSPATDRNKIGATSLHEFKRII